MWRGESSVVTAAATAWVEDWSRKNAERIDHLSANIIAAAHEAGDVTLYLIPRDRHKRCATGLVDPIGGLEVVGELVFSGVEEKQLIDSGEIDYFFIEEILRSVRTPLFVD